MTNEKQSRRRGKGREDEIVVFMVRRDTACSKCGEELWSGSSITLEDRQPLCLECADLDHLEYLPSGDAALTRRARKHSRLSPVVVQWSRTRKRYERQGVLAEPEAIARAEEECLADAELRERRKLRDALRGEELDVEYVEEFARRILEQYPGCPEREATQIAEHACRKYSGRIGRTAAAKEFDEEAIALAVRAAIRHRHTRYDELRDEGWDKASAWYDVEEEASEVERTWLRGGQST